MRWFKNLNFFWKLSIPIFLIAATTFVLSIDSIKLVNGLAVDGKRVTQEFIPSIDYVLEADRDAYQAQVAERSLLFLKAGTPDYIAMKKQHSENISQVLERVNKFAEITQIEEAKPYLDEFNAAFSNWKQRSFKAVEELDSKTRAGRTNAREISFGSALESFGKMRDSLDKLTELSLAEANVLSASMNENMESATVRQIVFLLVALFVCAIVALFFPRLITTDLNEINARLTDIAEGDGDLTERIHIESKDELGKLAGSVNRFIEKLQVMVGDIAKNTASVASAAEQLSTVSSEVHEAVTQESTAVDMVVTAITEMGAAVEEVASNTNQTAQQATDATEAATSGRELVTLTMTEIQSLSGEINDASNVISELEEEANSIASVLDVIRGIAEQTNLLALNAAIEAARAGEQGRGFAVVADEVRTLASKTQQSTQDIQVMIEKLQSGVGKAVSSMQEGTNKATRTVDVGEKASSSIAAIENSIQSINDMATQIATATEQQHQVADDINKNMTMISDLSSHSAERAMQVNQASAELAQLSSNLQDIVGNFKV